jgi:hypothetical protein
MGAVGKAIPETNPTQETEMVDNMKNQGTNNVNAPKTDKDYAKKSVPQNDREKIQGDRDRK